MPPTDLTVNVTVADWPPIKALIAACVAWREHIEWWPDNPPKVLLPAEQALLAAIEALPRRMEADVAETRSRAMQPLAGDRSDIGQTVCAVCGTPSRLATYLCPEHAV